MDPPEGKPRARTFLKSRFLWMWLGLVLLLPQYARTEQPKAPASSQETYRVGAGDVLFVSVEGQAELTGPAVVSRDGTILLPLIQRVSVLDRTPAEIEHEVAQRLGKDFLVDPKVSVMLREANSRQVYLMIGEGAAIARPLGAKETLSELLLQSGAPSKAFTSGEAVVTRTEAEKPGDPPAPRVVATVDLARLMLKNDPKVDVILKRGDVIRIPSPERRSVHLLVGDAPPVAIPLGEKGTLSELLLQSGVPSKVFASGEAVVTRTEPDKPGDPPAARVVATVDLTRLMLKSDAKADVVLQRGDVIRIPSPDRRYVHLLVGEAPAVSMPLSEKAMLSELLLDSRLPPNAFTFGQATVTRTVFDKPDGPPKSVVAAQVDLDRLMVKHDLSCDCELRPGDIVRIPSRDSRCVYLMVGDLPVEAVELGPKAMLSELLVQAKLPSGIFASGMATVTRIEKKEGDSEPKPHALPEVDLSGLMLKHDPKVDVALRPGDMVRIPKNAAKFVYILLERGPMSRANQAISSRPGPDRGSAPWGAAEHTPAQPPRPGSDDGVRIDKIKHPLDDQPLLSKVLLDADIPAELFETSAAIVSRIETSEVAKDGKTIPVEVTTSTVVDLYELMFDLDRTHDVDLKPNDIIHILGRRKVRDRGYVYLLGAVKAPGTYECRRRLDALALIGEAGGYSHRADAQAILIARASGGQAERHSLVKIEMTPAQAPELVVEAGDAVYVEPRETAPSRHVSVLGSVHRPGELPFEKWMTVGDALQKAGDTKGLVGSLGKIVVLRPSPQNLRIVCSFLRDALDKRHGGRCPELQPGDVVMVHP